MISRRDMLVGTVSVGASLLSLPAAADARDAEWRRALETLERRYGGRLGVAILDMGNKKRLAHRGDDRFPLCSTYKCLAAAFVLARVDRKKESLTRRIHYAKDDLVSYSPVTEKHVDTGMTVGDLCAAAVTLSDNTAGNLLLDSFGGPAGLTAYLRALGDRVTRLDRREPELNHVGPDDPRDTTTPLEMLETLRKTILGHALSAMSREQLAAWLVASKTGDKRLRVGVPRIWRVGDKTGSGPRNAANDIAVIWPPARAPMIVTAYYIDSHATEDGRNAVLADIGRLAAAV